MSDKEVERYLERILDESFRVKKNYEQIKKSLKNSSNNVEMMDSTLRKLIKLDENLKDINQNIFTTRLEMEGFDNVDSLEYNYRFEINDRKVNLVDERGKYIIDVYNKCTELDINELDKLNVIGEYHPDPFDPEIINKVYEIYDESSKSYFELIDYSDVRDPEEVLGIPRLQDLESRGIIETAKNRDFRNKEDARFGSRIIETYCGEEKTVENPRHLDNDFEIYAKSILDEEEFTRHRIQGEMVEQMDEIMKIAKMPYHERMNYEPGENKKGLWGRIFER